MKKLINKIEDLGWFAGEFSLDIKIKRRFEGYHGRASETWETEHSINTEGIKNDSGEYIFPILHEKSKRFETFEDFIKRIEAKL